MDTLNEVGNLSVYALLTHSPAQLLHDEILPSSGALQEDESL